jgi:hypothetical protein
MNASGIDESTQVLISPLEISFLLTENAGE